MTGRRTAFAVAVLVVAITSATVAGATVPAKNGRIAFVRFGVVTGVQSSEIFVTKADGTSEQRITQPPSGYRDDLPNWSPNGSKIVFQRCALGGGSCLVWSTSSDGTGPERLSPGCPAAAIPPACADDRSPVYSPDGRHIAFVRTKAKPVLMLADASLRRAHAVARLGSSRGSPYGVAWSPNGKQLVFASVNDARSGAHPIDGRAVYVVGANGTRARRLTPWGLEAGGRPDWSPDGRRILFHSYSNRLGGVGANLYTVRPDGTGLTRLTHTQDSDRVLDGSYSPDGASIVFSATAHATAPTQNMPDIVVMRADGTGVKPVTRSANWDASPDWGPQR
jgi:TolB protein